MPPAHRGSRAHAIAAWRAPEEFGSLSAGAGRLRLRERRAATPAANAQELRSATPTTCSAPSPPRT
jgi:hypothetical protein